MADTIHGPVAPHVGRNIHGVPGWYTRGLDCDNIKLLRTKPGWFHRCGHGLEPHVLAVQAVQTVATVAISCQLERLRLPAGFVYYFRLLATMSVK